jgi:hypothetical protein
MFVGAPQVATAQDGNEFRAAFQAIIDGLNDNSFRSFHDAIDDKAFRNRIFGTRLIDAEVREAFAADMRGTIESMFAGSFPRARSADEAGGEIIGTIVAFMEEGGQARAVVRYESRGYRFSWHSYDLVLGRGGRVTIIDWYDYYSGDWFTRDAGGALVSAMPDQRSVADLLELANPTQGQLFQAGELLKAVRDKNPTRYFQIWDGLEETLRREPYVTRLHFQYCRQLGDPRRLDQAIAGVVANYPDDPRYSLSLGEYYVSRRLFEEAISEYTRFQDALGLKDGASESLKATAAMALGDFERAEAFAVSATEVELGLELSWWTLLRARTAAADYAGATEALTQLEDRFGHLLIPQKLRRDRFLKVLIEQQEYKDWREARDAA